MFSGPLFRDRTQAGRLLAQKLKDVSVGTNPLVLALPRGGVPVGFEIARALHCDLDIFLVRKLGAPGEEELAFGAIASGGVRVLNQALIAQLGITNDEIERATACGRLEIERRERLYREGRSALPVQGRVAILVDDGLATGASMLAAVRAVRDLHPTRIIVAVPVASHDVCEEFQRHADEVICAKTPKPFRAVGLWYEDFSQTSDTEVKELLHRSLTEHVS